MKLPLKIAVVGCGGMGTGHVCAITGMGAYAEDAGITVYNAYMAGQVVTEPLDGKLELAGIYDIDPARMEWAASHGFHCYKDYDDMLADPDVDIILIALPNDLHKGHAIKAMRAGKHVLCEKPAMLSSQDMLDVIEVAKETGMVFYPRQNRRWDYDFVTIKEIFEKKLIGEVFDIESRVHGSNGIPGDWRHEKARGGGMMYDWGIHLLDRMLYMMEGYKLKTVFCRTRYATHDECDDGFTGIFVFENGPEWHVEVSTWNFEKLPLWYMCGEKGTVTIKDWSDMQGSMSVLTKFEDENLKPILAGEGLTKTMADRSTDSVTTTACPPVTVNRNELYLNLVDAINNGAELICKPEQTVRVLRLMEACFESSEKGIAVEFDK
ncbi:MAG: Gfo/Idh/MocA family oxidoreductase [Lachnospiraceae bacterium]|nr:Gfo/Idh/MocA family oxidoreductase [Lachnospiraceae bacterium]